MLLATLMLFLSMFQSTTVTPKTCSGATPVVSGINKIGQISCTADGVPVATKTYPLGTSSLLWLTPAFEGPMLTNSPAYPTAPTLALAAGAGMGIGAYSEVITFVTAAGETGLGVTAAITTTSGNQQISLTAIPTSSDPSVTGRYVCRTKVGGAIYYRVALINDNTTTTYTDSTADASLTVYCNAISTLSGTWNSTSGVRIMLIGDPVGTNTSNGYSSAAPDAR